MLTGLLCAAVLSGCGRSATGERTAEVAAAKQKEQATDRTESDRRAEADAAPDPYRRFEPEELKSFYDVYRYPDTTALVEPPAITGDQAADERVRAIAYRRGYRLRSEADPGSLVEVEGKRLQPAAAEAWRELEAAALAEGIELGLISGYRSVSRQREIFLSVLSREAEKAIGRAYTPEEIAAGDADQVVDAILRTYSIPGYSKHHTGYTVDITDVTSGRDFTEFGETAGFRWISADNYANAMRFGFLPSYPEGVADQGPIPEPWEYVWVGREALEREAD